MIVVHATNGNDRLFATHFFTNGSNAHFSSGIGSPALQWQQLPNMGQIDDDPSLTYSDTMGTTVYFKHGSEIMQTSGFQLGSNPVLPVRPVNGIEFSSAPAASAGWALVEQGTHVVIAKDTDDRLRIAVSFHDQNLTQ